MHAGFPKSDKIHFLPSFSATAAVVPLPAKKIGYQRVFIRRSTYYPFKNLFQVF
jgi:hypothetical protein